MKMLQPLRAKLIEALAGHPNGERLHFHLWSKKDYPNLHDMAMYSGKQITLETLEQMSVIRRKAMWEKTRMVNWNTHMQNLMTNGSTQLTDTGGTPRTIVVSASTVLRCDAASADSTYGIVVGSSAAVFSRTDTKLTTQVAHGVTSSTLQHSASSVGALTNPSGNINRIPLQRTYTGNTGSTVNIQEDGLYMKIGTSNWLFCMSRNLNGFGAVANAQVLTITRNWDDPIT
jgi:hypothetical protein